ncbi:unnamed protein product [Prorocentrum cordatum]|uniref:Uncharacterized protein n=1 Tax=Prorocentrum cordatum TaxID=2364126 RepID=A0ABN9UQB8_9DINO|nr:unnamed protein product [Polarella glacialis]
MLQGSAPGSLMCYGTATFCSRWAGICSSTASNVFARSPLRAAGGAAAHCCTRAGRPERADALAESAGRAAGAACAVADTRGMRREEQREEEEEDGEESAPRPEPGDAEGERGGGGTEEETIRTGQSPLAVAWASLPLRASCFCV